MDDFDHITLVFGLEDGQLDLDWTFTDHRRSCSLGREALCRVQESSLVFRTVEAVLCMCVQSLLVVDLYLSWHASRRELGSLRDQGIALSVIALLTLTGWCIAL